MAKRRGGWLVCPKCTGELCKMNTDGYVCLNCGHRFIISSEDLQCECGSIDVRTINTVIISEKNRIVNVECRICGERWQAYEEIREYSENSLTVF